MRISTNTLFELGSGRISDLQSSLVKTQQQISTQRRVLTPADDPIAAAAALGVTQSLGMAEQYATNRQYAKSSLNEEEGVLKSVTSLFQDVKTLVVGAGNGIMNDSNRQALVTELRSRYQELLSLANSRDGNGNYMFSGFQTSTQPFSPSSGGGADYVGDQGQRMLQVSASRQLALNDSGASVFVGNRTGNGKFATAPATANTGTGAISAGSVTDMSQLAGRKYKIDFSVDSVGAATYSITDADPATAPATALPTGVPYVDGQSIKFGGMQFEISGKPADGDSFSVEPSANQSIFTTLDKLLTAMAKPIGNATEQVQLSSSLKEANLHLDNALDNVLSVRADLGARLKEIDSLDSAGDDLQLQYNQTLSDLQDVDLAKAISSFTQQQQVLQAAQQSFIAISGLSLFSLMR